LEKTDQHGAVLWKAHHADRKVLVGANPVQDGLLRRGQQL
jgi:hypothetical protein